MKALEARDRRPGRAASLAFSGGAEGAARENAPRDDGVRGQRARPALAALPVGAVARGRRLHRGLDRRPACASCWSCGPRQRKSFSTAPIAASMPASSTTSRGALLAAQALDGEVLVAYAMNGAPLPPQHGAPLRLIVPRWYGMASVKWLRAIEARERPFDGLQQARSYHFRRVPGEKGEPCTLMRVNSLMAPPGNSRLLYAPAHRRCRAGRDHRPRMVGRGDGRARRVRARRSLEPRRCRGGTTRAWLDALEIRLAGGPRRARARLPRHRRRRQHAAPRAALGPLRLRQQRRAANPRHSQALTRPGCDTLRRLP